MMNLTLAPDIHKNMTKIIKKGLFPQIDPAYIVCMRSEGATSRARARIWAFPRIWQMALNIKPHYVIEFLTQHFDHLSEDDRLRVIIHELMHIPKNFSGALVPHRGKYHQINNRTVEKLFKEYKEI
jgi:predicted metallopeptidase